LTLHAKNTLLSSQPRRIYIYACSYRRLIITENRNAGALTTRKPRKGTGTYDAPSATDHPGGCACHPASSPLSSVEVADFSGLCQLLSLPIPGTFSPLPGRCPGDAGSGHRSSQPGVDHGPAVLGLHGWRPGTWASGRALRPAPVGATGSSTHHRM